MKLRILALLLSAALFACASTPQTAAPEREPEKILARMDNLQERPDWIHESVPLRFAYGKAIALGSTEIGGDERIPAAFKIAEVQAKGLIASAIEQRLEQVFRAQEGKTAAQTSSHSVALESSRLVTSALQPERRYWERLARTLDNGERVTRVRVFATVSMEEREFQKAILKALRKSPEQARLLEAQWDTFKSETGTRAGAQ